MPLLILLGLVVAEIFLIIVVGGWIGAVPTILLLIASSAIGGYLLKREGSKALRALRAAQAQRRPPHKELADGVLIFVGGVLMLLPGFLSDIVGLLCLFPPTRALLRNGILTLLIRRLPPTLRFRPGRGLPPVIEGEIDPRTGPR